MPKRRPQWTKTQDPTLTSSQSPSELVDQTLATNPDAEFSTVATSALKTLRTNLQTELTSSHGAILEACDAITSDNLNANVNAVTDNIAAVENQTTRKKLLNYLAIQVALKNPAADLTTVSDAIIGAAPNLKQDASCITETAKYIKGLKQAVEEKQAEFKEITAAIKNSGELAKENIHSLNINTLPSVVAKKIQAIDTKLSAIQNDLTKIPEIQDPTTRKAEETRLKDAQEYLIADKKRLENYQTQLTQHKTAHEKGELTPEQQRKREKMENALNAINEAKSNGQDIEKQIDTLLQQAEGLSKNPTVQNLETLKTIQEDIKAKEAEISKIRSSHGVDHENIDDAFSAIETVNKEYKDYLGDNKHLPSVDLKDPEFPIPEKQQSDALKAFAAEVDNINNLLDNLKAAHDQLQKNPGSDAHFKTYQDLKDRLKNSVRKVSWLMYGMKTTGTLERLPNIKQLSQGLEALQQTINSKDIDPHGYLNFDKSTTQDVKIRTIDPLGKQLPDLNKIITVTAKWNEIDRSSANNSYGGSSWTPWTEKKQHIGNITVGDLIETVERLNKTRMADGKPPFEIDFHGDGHGEVRCHNHEGQQELLAALKQKPKFEEKAKPVPDKDETNGLGIRMNNA